MFHNMDRLFVREIASTNHSCVAINTHGTTNRHRTPINGTMLSP
jgi:hypothetical protein